MSGTGAPRLLRAVPPSMWSSLAPKPDLPAELERARDFGAAGFEELDEAHRLLDPYDPDPEPGDLLPERLARVLAALSPITAQEAP